MENRLIREELSYDCVILHNEFNELYASLNSHQLRVFDTVIQVVEENSGGLFFCLWQWENKKDLSLENTNIEATLPTKNCVSSCIFWNSYFINFLRKDNSFKIQDSNKS